MYPGIKKFKKFTSSKRTMKKIIKSFQLLGKGNNCFLNSLNLNETI